MTPLIGERLPLRAAPADFDGVGDEAVGMLPGEGFISKPEFTARARVW